MTIKVYFEDTSQDRGSQFPVLFFADHIGRWQDRLKAYCQRNKSLRIVCGFRNDHTPLLGGDFCDGKDALAEFETHRKNADLNWEPMNILLLARAAGLIPS